MFDQWSYIIPVKYKHIQIKLFLFESNHLPHKHMKLELHERILYGNVESLQPSDYLNK